MSSNRPTPLWDKQQIADNMLANHGFEAAEEFLYQMGVKAIEDGEPLEAILYLEDLMDCLLWRVKNLN